MVKVACVSLFVDLFTKQKAGSTGQMGGKTRTQAHGNSLRSFSYLVRE